MFMRLSKPVQNNYLDTYDEPDEAFNCDETDELETELEEVCQQTEHINHLDEPVMAPAYFVGKYSFTTRDEARMFELCMALKKSDIAVHDNSYGDCEDSPFKAEGLDEYLIPITNLKENWSEFVSLIREYEQGRQR